jgi:Abortive infection C-terminus
VTTTKRFSIQTITALTEIVTGGSANDRSPSIGHYRSGPKLERFFGALNISLRVGNASRVPSVQSVLQETAYGRDGLQEIIRVIEAVADPRDYLDLPEKLAAVVEYMNKRLVFDGFELRKIGGLYKVVGLATETVAATALQEKAKALDLGSVHADFERALSQADHDPPDAITSACSTVESVCKCILDEMNKPYPANKDVKGLLTEVAKHLNLSPGRDDLPKEWEHDIRQILSGLFTVVGGIGALRTHAGDAHGKGKTRVPVDPRIARLAIHAASTVSLFYIETWQRAATTRPT